MRLPPASLFCLELSGRLGWTFWDLKTEAPDLFIHLAHADLVIFKVRPSSSFFLELG